MEWSDISIESTVPGAVEKIDMVYANINRFMNLFNIQLRRSLHTAIFTRNQRNQRQIIESWGYVDT